MIVQRLEHTDRPNEVAVYFTADQLCKVDTAIAEEGITAGFSELPEEHQRSYCRRILDLQGGEPKRRLVDLEGQVRLDSKELGHDLVARFETPQDPDVFDPNYQPVDFNFRVLDEEGQQAVDDFLVSPDMTNSSRIEKALNTARLVVSFCFSPPNLA